MIATNQTVHLDYPAVARRYRRSVRWVRDLVRFKRIPHIKIGGAVIFPLAALEQWENRLLAASGFAGEAGALTGPTQSKTGALNRQHNASRGVNPAAPQHLFEPNSQP